MLAVLSGGGTAGHINPALALADELVSRGWDVRFAGTPGGVESRLVPAAGIPFTAFEASGFDRSHPASLAKGVAKIAASTGKAKKWFADIKPDVVVGFGGYVCIPVARAAEKTGVPVVLHEQNSVAGMANKYLARRADAVCVTYECSAESLGAAAPVTVTGNPRAPFGHRGRSRRGPGRCSTLPRMISCCSSSAGLWARATSTRPSSP